MKVLIFIFFSLMAYKLNAQALEAMARTGESTILMTTDSIPAKISDNMKSVGMQPLVQQSEMHISIHHLPNPSHQVSKRFLKNTTKYKKKFLRKDSIPDAKKSVWKSLGCFLKEPLQLISLGVDMFELTKPPKNNSFLIVLYVIYIIPLFAVIVTFIIVGVTGLLSFIFACGILSFLLYWGILALLGIALGGNFLLWGLIGAFIAGLVLYLLLIRLCEN